MKNFRFTIGNKILGGFITLILIFIIYAGITIFTVSTNSKLTEKNSNIIKPSVTAIKDFNLLIIRSKMLVTNWVYLQSNEADKQSLVTIHEEEYPAMKDRITDLKEMWDEERQAQEMDTIFKEFEELLGFQKEIMESLVTFENYEDAIVKFMASESIKRIIANEKMNSELVELNLKENNLKSIKLKKNRNCKICSKL